MGLFGNGMSWPKSAVDQWMEKSRENSVMNGIRAPEASTQSPAKRGLFGGGAFRAESPLWKVMGGIGDVLSGDSRYTDGLMQQNMLTRKSLMEQAQAEAERAARRQDFMFEHDYKRNNPMPSDRAPYRWEGNDGDVYELGPDGQPKRIFDDPTPKMNFIPDGMGGGQWVAVPTAAPSVPQGGSTLPPGYTKRPKGGPASAPGGFPR